MNICAQIISYVMTNLSDDSNLQEETTKSLPNVNFGDSSYVLLNFSFQGFNCQSFCRRLFLKTFCLFSFYKSLNRIPFRNEFINSEFPISKIASCSPVALLTLLGDRATAFNLPKFMMSESACHCSKLKHFCCEFIQLDTMYGASCVN